MPLSSSAHLQAEQALLLRVEVSVALHRILVILRLGLGLGFGCAASCDLHVQSAGCRPAKTTHLLTFAHLRYELRQCCGPCARVKTWRPDEEVTQLCAGRITF